MKKVFSATVLLALLSVSFSIPALGQKQSRPLSGQLNKRQGTKQVSALASETRFASFAAYSDGIRGVWLRWEMISEVENLGFHVYRVSKRGVQSLNPDKPVAGSAMRAREIPEFGQSYDYYDREGTLNDAYYIEALSISAASRTTGTVYPQYVSDLTSATGLAADEVDRRGRKAVARQEWDDLAYPEELAREIAENSAVPDPVTHRTVISRPGVRIGVKREGMYRVTRAELQAAGFDVNASGSLWQLYVEGVEQAIVVGGNDDYIEFYGKGTDTPETDFRVYFLIVGTSAGKRMTTRAARPPTSTVLSPHYALRWLKKERQNFLEDILNGDAENYWGRLVASSATTFTFNLSGVDFNTPTTTVEVKFLGYSAGFHSVEISLNDNVLTNVTGIGVGEMTGTYTLPTSTLREGLNSLRLRSAGPSPDFSFFDSISVAYDRKYVAEDNRVGFYTYNDRNARLHGFTSANVRLLDTTFEGNPILVTGLVFQESGGTYGTDLPAYRARSYYAVEESAFFAADSITPNNPELLGESSHEGRLVIISHKNFLPEANAWAEYRRGQGIPTKVVEVTDIFDEYAYGETKARSIRSFLEDAVARWQVVPQYALLIGDASVDARNYENQGAFNFVPSDMVRTVYSETASDESLADFNNDGLAEIAIGRIASRTNAGIATVFQKVVHWEAYQTPLINRGGVFAYDHNQGYSFDLMSQSLRNQIPGMPAIFIYRGDANATANLIAALNTGKFVVNWAGHGTSGSWAGSGGIFNVTHVPTLNDDVNSPALFTMLTCLNGAFHYLYNESFAEVLTKANNRGAVSAWASTGKTTPDIQQLMAERFYFKLGEGNITRLGDLVKDAKTVVPGGRDVRLSWALIGDPMLKVRP